MLQLSRTIRSILLACFSLGLFLVAYISFGWGSALARPYSLALTPIGAMAYSGSLVIAVRSGQKWLLAAVASLGAVLAALVLLVSVEAFIDASPGGRWIPAIVMLVLVVNCVGLVLFFKAQRKQGRTT